MEEKEFLDYDGLALYDDKIKMEFEKKVNKEEGKGLSTNDLTDELLNKINNAGDSSFTGNYNDLINKPTIPTDNSQLGNGAGYQNASGVQSLISNALDGITGIDFQVVVTLPAMGTKGVIYLMANNKDTDDSYDEYIWLNDKFEKIGTTKVDLTRYLKEEDIIPISNEKINALFD